MFSLTFITLSLGLSHCKSILEEDYFEPSLALSSINASTFARSDLPMHPLLGPEERKSITFEEDFNDVGIGNLDYTSSYEEDLRKVRTLLQDLAEDPLYYDSVRDPSVFVPVAAKPSVSLPTSPPAVKIVVKGLPSGGARPLPENYPGLWRAPPPPPPDHPLCDDKIEPQCIAIVPGFPGCLEDDEFPTTSLQFALYQDGLSSRKLPKQSEPEQEFPADASINYIEGYTSAFSPQHWDNYQGFLCPSRVEFVRPLRLRNTEGRWRVIVNLEQLSQTVRVETCLTKAGGCRLLPPCYQSHCTQLHTFHRLLSYNPCSPQDGLTIDTFRLPSGCSCAIGA